MVNCKGISKITTAESSPEKAGVGGSTPSRGTIKSTTSKPANARTCSNLFHKSNPGPARVCLSRSSVDAAVCDFASFLRIHFVDTIAADPRAFKKLVLRLIRRDLPPKPGRPNDPRAPVFMHGGDPKDHEVFARNDGGGLGLTGFQYTTRTAKGVRRSWRESSSCHSRSRISCRHGRP